jgi:hypothetical protein
MLAKKAVIAKLRGDAKLANDWAARYLAVYETAKKRTNDEFHEG